MFLNTLQAVAMVALVGLLGFVLISRRIVAEQALTTLSRLALEIALPSLIFTRIVSRFRPADMPDWWIYPAGFVAFTAGTALLTLLTMPLVRRSHRREFGASLFYPNAVFLPLILIIELHGPDSRQLLALFFYALLFSPFYFATHAFFFRAPNQPFMRWHRILNPVFWATTAAIALCLLGAQALVPRFVLNAGILVGAMSAPLLLIVLGGTIRLDLPSCHQIPWRDVTYFVITKNLVFPLVTIAALRQLHLPPTLATILVIQSAVPPITSLPIVAQRAGGNRQIVSQFLVASFALSIVTMPLALTLFTLWR